MKRIAFATLLVALPLAFASLGFVLGGHEEVLTVVVADGPQAFHHDYYRCWQTKMFSVCDALPDNLEAGDRDDFTLNFPNNANVTF